MELLRKFQVDQKVIILFTNKLELYLERINSTTYRIGYYINMKFMKNWNKRILALLLLVGSVNLASGQITVKILDKDIDLEITKLDQLNSTYEETNLSITPSGKYIFFQSERPSGPDAKIYGIDINSAHLDEAMTLTL